MKKRKILINEEELQNRITQLAKQITTEYEGKELTFICVLKGAMFFFTDLTRQIDLDMTMEVIRVSSYQGENSTGKVDFKLGLDEPVTGKDVIVVEDIVDTGRTLTEVMKYLKAQNPQSIKLCSLLDKPDRRVENELAVDYVGFTIPNYFVIGYGLDYDEKYRNLPSIEYIVDEE